MGYVLGCGVSQESGMPLGFRCEYRGEASGECESVRVNGGARAVVFRSSEVVQTLRAESNDFINRDATAL